MSVMRIPCGAACSIGLCFLNLARIATATPPPPPPEALLTVAERSGFTATARHADVMAIVAALRDASPLVRTGSLGRSLEGRELPLIIIADPPVATAEEAAASGKLVVFAFANIHGGEVCGKEALPMLAREIVLDAAAPQNRILIDNLVLAFAPIYNADGNERFSKDNRPGQVGPEQGTGERANAQGLDLNRDHVKLDAPETRAMVAFLNEWNPHVIFDLHTTNGSIHRYTLTYDTPLNTASHPAPIAFLRDTLLPEATRRLEAGPGWKTFWYGNFNREMTAWETYGCEPRYAAHYHGLHNRMSILSEAYSNATYRDRVLCTRDFVRTCLEIAAQRRGEIMEILERAERETIAAAGNGEPVAIRHRMAASDEPVSVLGYAMDVNDRGRPVATDEEREHVVQHFGRFEPAVSVARPAAYLVPASLTDVVRTLHAHGVRMERLDQPRRMVVEATRVKALSRSPRPYQGRTLVSVDEVEAAAGEREIEAGSLLVGLDQPLGSLIVALLEAQAEDGLAAWGLFEDHLVEGGEYPVLRVLAKAR